jgi:hypothetical protein
VGVEEEGWPLLSQSHERRREASGGARLVVRWCGGEWLVAQARVGGSRFQTVVVVVGMGSCLSCRVSCRPEWYRDKNNN